MKTKWLVTFWITFAFAFQAIQMRAEFSVAGIFGSNMVVQRDKPILIWGRGTPGEVLQITFDDHMAQTTIAEDGSWRVELPAKQAGGPFSLDVNGSTNIHFENILVGDIWLCSGQSNMEWKLFQTQYEETDSNFLARNNVRLFTVQVAWDCMPADDIAGGQWQNLSEETIQLFSAVAYHFGKALNKDLDVPIGLINSSLGATCIEAWMSNDALMQFEQFRPDIEPVLDHGMNHEVMKTEFEKIRNSWETEHYLRGPGVEGKWYLPETDRSDWGEIEVPGYWDGFGLANHDGAVWYSKEFDLPENYDQPNFMLQLNQIRDYDVTWVNGKKVGETYGRHTHRTYFIDTEILKPTGNVIVVRAFDTGGLGGFTTSAFWGNPLLLGKWKFKKGLSIDASTFPKVTMPNVSPFSSPGVLFNSNIAPLTDLAIRGAIWYQGESNVMRAYEYRDLLPAMISDWRTQWGDEEFPFLIVQLANHHQPDLLPSESDWAELREAQYKAIRLPNTGIACIIDIGEANDIHPRNKEDVGKRLALSAAKVAYGKDVVHSGPAMSGINYHEDEIHVYFNNVGSGLVSTHPDGLLGGFAIQENGTYHWADAYIKDKNTVVIRHNQGAKPLMVRYAWADNPVHANLFNSEGLPALPFRTDTYPGQTYGIKYNSQDDRF